MEDNWHTLDLCMEEYNRKYFIVLIDAIGYQVSPIISLFCKYSLTKIINLNLSRVP